MKDNVNLNGSTGVQIREHKDEDMIEGVSSLRIFQAKRADTGEYICKANNSVGTTSRSANLTVVGMYVWRNGDSLSNFDQYLTRKFFLRLTPQHQIA